MKQIKITLLFTGLFLLSGLLLTNIYLIGIAELLTIILIINGIHKQLNNKT